MNRQSVVRPDHQRLAIADEAARIIHDEGLADYRSAKYKALERLGLRTKGTRLPSNEEIERALAERLRIFRGEDHTVLLDTLRAAALEVMQALKIYHARLVGPVLHGTATDHSSIDLHLFSDSPENIDATLSALGYVYRPIQLRHQFRKGQPERFPGYQFSAQDFAYSATVFSLTHRRRTPLSPVDGRPMQRAGISQLAALLA